MNVTKLERHAGWLAFWFPLVIYTLTLCPTVYWGDSGELIMAAYSLGIPHPPGHPLYAIVGKIFSLIPFGSIAWRVNFMSAFFGALTCLFVHKIIIERIGPSAWRVAAALGGTFFFAFGPTMWDQATIAETSTFHSFFMMVLTLLVFRMAAGENIWKNEQRSLCLFSFLYGFSLTNHVAGVFFFPAFAYILIATFKKRIFSLRQLLKMLGAFAVGLLVYSYLPLRSLADPLLDWGNPENLENFLWVVTARQFRPEPFIRPSVFVIAFNLSMRGKSLLNEFTVVGCALGLVGAWAFFRRERRLIIYSLLVIVVLFYVGLNKAFISAYFIPALALMGVWIGVGLNEVFVLIARLSERFGRSSSASTMTRKALCCLLAASFVLPLGIHFDDMDKSDDLWARRYGQHMLDRLPEGSALFTTNGWALFILWYLIYCEKNRPDLIVLDPTWLISSSPLASQVLEQFPGLWLPSLQTVKMYASRGGADAVKRQFFMAQAVLDENSKHRPVYWGYVSGEEPFTENLIPLGPMCLYSPTPVTLDEKMLAQNRQFWISEIEYFRSHPAMKKDKVSIEIYPSELNNQGMVFESLGRDDLFMWAVDLALELNPEYPGSRYNRGMLEARLGHYDEAIADYLCAIKINPAMAVASYNLGNAYRSTGRYDEAFLSYRRAARLYPDYYEALTAMGRLYSLAGQNKDAIEEFKKALKINPEYTFALRGLASAYLEMGRSDLGKEALDRALQLEPDSAHGLFLLAKYNLRTGNTSGALSALRRSCEMGGSSFLERAREDEDLKDLADDISTGGG